MPPPAPHGAGMPQSRTLSVDLSWRKRTFHITDTDQANQPELYSIHCHSNSDRTLSIYSMPANQLIGTSTIYSGNSSPDYELYGFKGIIRAEKHLRTSYSFPSWAYANPTTRMPVQMTWISQGGLKTWDFVCVNERQDTVAKFTANMWAMKNVGMIEMLGPKAFDRTACDEIVVVGLTLYYGWLMRISGLPLGSVGSALSSTDKRKKKKKKEKKCKENGTAESLGEMGDVIGILNDAGLIG